ncbi:MAG: flap endonuclease-1 [Thermoprotei archaeon]|nr:MAG: flap endonuclease-1 [Thermoprotei archaeon]
MGVNLKPIIVKRDISFNEIKGRRIAIDAYNALYQFLATIRQIDGKPLMDSQGNVTSHLNGLLYRTVNLLEKDIRPVYVFDGKPPELKKAEILRRMEQKSEAIIKYEEALKRGDLEEARIYAQQTSKLTTYMVDEAKKLLTYLGVPWVQAPSEGEAQAAYMVVKGDVWASASQDYDSLLYGAPRLIRNLTISGRRKIAKRNMYINISLELIFLEEVLKKLDITRVQLIDIAILLGTDYNPGGVRGIGPKKALELIKRYGGLEKIIKIIGKESFNVDPFSIREIFLKPEISDDYKLEWGNVDEDKLIKLLCDSHDFSYDRVKKAIERVKKAYDINIKQMRLESWFG